ncbi:MAG: hypothetical protein QOI77_1726 [Blastocatellia bacterium]|jgi:uncharacterized protein YecE (DUF72 family)|nr:hypothetical protein [Blastocatellia bacterium]
MSSPKAALLAARSGNTDCWSLAGRAKVGTCGFGLAKDAYAKAFSCVEVQHTFYQPPQPKTLERWRREMPADFEFTLKAWQLITHDAKSPTFRRLKRKLAESEKHEAGYFRPTAIVKEAWEVTRAAARTLRTKTILFQCPASFRQTKENIANLEKFFSAIDRQDLTLCWEPRGNWDNAIVASICADLELCHVVDPFVAKTMTPSRCYFRLHGRQGWRYQYESGELEELAADLPKRGGYVFFNNSQMTEDAMKFCQALSNRDER